MVVAAGDMWIFMGHVLGICAAIVCAALAAWLWPRRAAFRPAGTAIAAALLLTAVMEIANVAAPPGNLGATIAESLRNLGWLLVIYRLFSGDGRHASLAPIRPVVLSLAFVECLQLSAAFVVTRLPDAGLALRPLFEFSIIVRLLLTVGALVLIHNLYAGASRDVRTSLRWPAAALAVVYGFDLNLYTIAYLSDAWPAEIAVLRGAATIIMGGLIMVGASKGRDFVRIRPSRAVTFQTFSLMVIGIYLVAMVAIAQWLSYMGGDFARVMELVFVTLASATALLVLPSKRVRGWLKVTLAKHLFQHRYDYREEWLRFTRTIGNSGSEAAPLGERVVQAVADIPDCPAGLLLTPGDHGDLTLAARWNWPELEVPAAAIPTASVGFFERENYIVDLDDIRAEDELSAIREQIPAWLIEARQAWALVPLVHFERLIGMVVLARPALVRKLDWEDFDLLRVVGQQLASYLAENSSQEALAEASRFDEFHRRIAFVMHDIKNLASQLSLLARNAEKHADNPEFRADMLVTLRNSSDKLTALLARLGRYGKGAVDRLQTVSAEDVLARVMSHFQGNEQVVLTQAQNIAITANVDSLEQVLVHLVQNGLDASQSESPVFVSVSTEGLNARFEVLDSGSGMSPDFVRHKLFKPFYSTKNGGFGIGAFEARELVRAMRGRLEVESREGLGSRFVVRIPLSAATDIFDNINGIEQRVA
ncbi:histidine kinase [Novosphingobium sp. PC22D]|uniref:XrtA/PEP-CTERM system histidine kinase PrsK n=1 Tax=Novosphingobium sp. PC22D TaxID=1962403 RepID=UPI000BFB058B|nr:XrtA/PEP-CTERM system histidine kinase PrsK [Novosphingobium sp. PC22D]PEQ11068.1 histidine kinase [Novosphingobium sp. PC22D]